MCETEHIRLEEEIRWRNFRFHETEKDWVRLREKSSLIDAKVNKLENEIKEVFLIEKLRMERKGAYSHTNKLESYRCELVILLPWMISDLTKRSD